MWKIEYENEPVYDSEGHDTGYDEKWIVTNNKIWLETESSSHAEWLLEKLNSGEIKALHS